LASSPSASAAFDPLDPAVRRCPHQHYAQLNAHPVTPVSGHPNFYLVSGYDTVSEVLMDPYTYDGQPFPDHEVAVMSAMRPEPHQRLRGAIQSLFTVQALAKLKPHIEKVVRLRTDQLLAASSEDRRGGEPGLMTPDLMKLWANPIPLSVIAAMFGFPDSDADLQRLHRYGDAAVRLIIPLGGPGLPVPSGWAARLRRWRGLATAAPLFARFYLGLPRADRRQLGKQPDPFIDQPGLPRTGFAQHPELIREIGAFNLEVLNILKARQREPGDEVVDLLVAACQRGELSMAEAVFGAAQILVAGYETTANTLASAVFRLAQNPAQLAELQADPSKIEAFIEELLRLDAPLQRTLRRTTKPVTLAGVALPENAQLIIMLGAANLDSQKFEHPEAFNPQRANARRHLAFGRGIHMCIGAQLARLESTMALTELLSRVERIQLCDNDPPQRLTDKDVGMWGFTRLPVKVRARGGS